jgi:hypothetical protein
MPPPPSATDLRGGAALAKPRSMHTALPSPHPARSREHLLATAAICAALLGIASAFLVKLAIAGLVLCLLSFLAVPKGAAGPLRLARVLLLCAAPLVLVGLVRFTIDEAMPGLVEGGHRALTGRAVAKLRVIRFAEDLAREQAYWDPDGDGVGSALSLLELTGRAPMRGVRPAPQGLVMGFERSGSTPVGEAFLADGFVFLLYLPGPHGEGTARGGTPIDDERAERRWVAYAWPIEDGHGERPIVFIDEHERVLVSDNRGERQGYFGLERPPPFDAALTGPTLEAQAAVEGSPAQDGGTWLPWRGKRPRASLPGDKAPR